MATSSLSNDSTRNFQCVTVAIAGVIKLPLRDILASRIQPKDLFQKIHSCSTLKLRPDQLKLCFIPPPDVPDYNKFDVTLLYTLIRNLCSLPCPAQGWGKEPTSNDTQISDDIERLRLFRNNFSAHAESAVISDAVFKDVWKNLKFVFRRMQSKTGSSVDYEEELLNIEQQKITDDIFITFRVLLEALTKLEKHTDDEPDIFIQGENEILCGGTARFEADVKNVESPCWSITWQKQRGDIIKRIDTNMGKYSGSTKRKLVINDVSKEDEGEYQAVLSLKSKGPEYKSRNIIPLYAVGVLPIAENPPTLYTTNDHDTIQKRTTRLLGYPMVPPIIHSGSSLNSRFSGAFQPKKKASGLLHPRQMIPDLRDPEKVSLSAASLPHHKKSGKWCSMHVQIALKINHHQQESPDVSKGGEGKSEIPLQSGMNLSSNNHHRPTDLNMSSSLLGMSSFPRSSSHPFTSHECFGDLGKGGSPFGTLGREMQNIPGKAFPYEWSGLHKSTYPSPFFRSHWSKPDEREKAIEKEREKVVLGLDERREERKRERRSSDLERRISVYLDQPCMGVDLRHTHTVSHSRSRSPLVGGRVVSAKSDTSYNCNEREKEKRSIDFNYHSLQIQTELEQERERMLRFRQPQSMGLYDLDRVRKAKFLMQEERLRREYFDRIQQLERERFEREKLAFESSRLSRS